MELLNPAADDTVIAALDAVAQPAYGQASFASQFRWAAAAQPDGLVMAVEGGTVLGVGSAVAYPDAGFGWIGLIATLPAVQRRGIGEAVTERCAEILRRYGCAPVLDASAAGAPLYERMGFVDHGRTTILQYGGQRSAPTPGIPGDRIRAMSPADLATVTELDHAAFGARRPALLAAMTTDRPSRSVVLERDGVPVGFAVAQETGIGPLVGPDVAGIAALVDTMVTAVWANPPRVMAPAGTATRDDLVALGFQPARELRHMRRGIDTLPTDAVRYAGRATLGLG